ncbi:hypothetical protein ACWEJP_28635, partial [Streptomyces sp. NPDC004749]
RQNTFKVGVNALIGNPHASEEEIAQQSWGEVSCGVGVGGVRVRGPGQVVGPCDRRTGLAQ